MARKTLLELLLWFH